MLRAGHLLAVAHAALMRVTLPTDEARARCAIERAFAIAAARPRITRMYIFHWRAFASSRFDAGLVRPDGSDRPFLQTLCTGSG